MLSLCLALLLAQAAPKVDDPLLAPPPEATHALRSWDEALALVHKQSPEYLANFENIVRAEAQSRIALASALPNLNAQASFTHQLITQTLTLGAEPAPYPPQDVFGLGATFSWQILNPRALYELGSASRFVDASKLAFADRRRQIAVRLVHAMLATLATARVAELDRVGLRSALERQSLAQTKLQFGEGTELDVERTRQDADSARSLIINGDESLVQSREALGLALGAREPVAAPGDLNLADFEASVLRTCQLSDDVEKRPDVAAARTRVELAERQINSTWLQLAPSLGLQSGLLYESKVVFGPHTTWAIAGVLTIPLYDGGMRYGQVREARALAEQARQELQATRLSALVNVAQAQRSVAVLKASREIAQEQRDLAQRIDQRTREGYAQGRGTSLDLVTSAQALRQAEINLAILAFQSAEARANAVLSNAECVY